MPTLQFKGKNIIWNHHLSVPYHTLEEVAELHFQPEKANGNLIIEGDNLLALKALLPMYAGKVKCICIDPPYNTGNEGWAYNDRVNSPLIKDWLNKEVGKDDMTRHDKWLCMMTPRLKLLRELLADDGAIFVNIDNNEIHHLRMLMEEVFPNGYVSQIAWKGKSGAEDDEYYRTVNEHILVYAKNKQSFMADQQIKTNENFPKYDPIKKKHYKTQLARKWGSNSRREDRPKLYYPIDAPNGLEIFPKLPDGSDGCWRWDVKRMEKEINAGNIEFEKRNGEWVVYQKIYAPEKNEGPRTKKFNTWLDEVGTTSNGTDEIKELFGESAFNHPKPTSLIKRLLQMVNTKYSIILDSFSGSGTTGHAVLDLNKEDGGNRKFILVQMTEATEKEPNKNICKDITRERIKRAIEKYGYNSGFQYLRVGQPLDADTLLEGNLPDYKTFAKYIYYLCTGENLKEEKKIKEKDFFVGTFGRQAIYLIYKQDFEKLTRMALNLEIAEKIIAEQPNKKRIVYAPACFLDEEYMEANQIEFVGIPYNLFQRKT